MQCSIQWSMIRLNNEAGTGDGIGMHEIAIYLRPEIANIAILQSCIHCNPAIVAILQSLQPSQSCNHCHPPFLQSLQFCNPKSVPNGSQNGSQNGFQKHAPMDPWEFGSTMKPRYWNARDRNLFAPRDCRHCNLAILHSLQSCNHCNPAILRSCNHYTSL